LTEYSFNRETGKISEQYVYTNLEIILIKGIAQLGHLAVVGGEQRDDFKYQNQCVQVIDLQNKRSARRVQQTAVKYNIYSLEFWRKSKSELVLYVGGNEFDFSAEDSVLFDLSHAMKLNLVSPSQGLSKEVAITELGKIT
jgi:hypothetical protein